MKKEEVGQVLGSRFFPGPAFFSGKCCKRRRKRQLELINDFLVCPRRRWRWRREGRPVEREGNMVVAGRGDRSAATTTWRQEIKKGRRIIFVSFYLLAPAFYRIVPLPPAAACFKWVYCCLVSTEDVQGWGVDGDGFISFDIVQDI